jgi:hypothetical protein
MVHLGWALDNYYRFQIVLGLQIIRDLNIAETERLLVSEN